MAATKHKHWNDNDVVFCVLAQKEVQGLIPCSVKNYLSDSCSCH